MPKSQQESKSLPLNTEDAGERAVRLIRELAIRPPAKDVANVKAASEVFEANATQTPTGASDPHSAEPPKRRDQDKD